ncbi:retron St85 family RNA-directed DNA polymerase [Herbaspirillum sp. C9C3]|uniref:retron St85 family RNA-directed DNA polymerase n=1 Tax=Herbaspirillum sp. C9C3 TaxID=2735271 RepID=UPI0015854901|nr:retron St85 family RNA-directed DNA polymerase [Herbaspirillum sp. C9C3]NUT60149.1 RNA-directed DNA polymerase [Herbaspirillum sp. C9C3]
MLLKELMLESLPFSSGELEVLIGTAPFRYKEYKIPKRDSDKFRQISQPTPEVKLLQRWVVVNVLSQFPVHPAATAYRSGRGLLENVRPHQKNRFLLKVDFKDFFPSITSENFKVFLKESSYSDAEIRILCNILFKLDRRTEQLRLAIGAPSSPALSNILMYRFDEVISKFCDRLYVVYTRYADDLTFSTNERDVLCKVEKALPEVIAEFGLIALTVNQEKTRHASKKTGRQITGLNISSEGEVSIGRDRKRLLRVQIFKFSKGELTADEIDSLRGYIAFLQYAEPAHVTRLRSSFGDDLISRLCS